MSDPSQTLESAATSPFDRLQWKQSFVRELQGEKDGPNTSRQVRGVAYSRVAPTAVAAPQIVGWADEVAALLDIADADPGNARSAACLSGNELVAGMAPYAACYGGHQFGNWAGQLGDGRAITLGEVKASTGRYEVQLKGAGPTPYSRGADGRAVLRSSVREFLCSEAMHALGIPTTRALSLVRTGDEVIRDMFYDGHPKAEPGAIVCRVAPSFLRFGSYQLPASRDEQGLLQALLDYTLRHHYPQLGTGRDGYVALYQEVCKRTAQLVAGWMRVGFVHGVLNTDNMSVLGLTIDYGPYGWMDAFDPEFTPNTTDAQGRRYAFGRQPAVVGWNLARFGEALLPLIEDVGPLQVALDAYEREFSTCYRQTQLEKLGLFAGSTDEDEQLLGELMALFMQVETDMTIFYRRLAECGPERQVETLNEAQCVAPLLPAFYDDPAQLPAAFQQRLAAWLRTYTLRTRAQGVDPESRRQGMSRVNPKYVLRNYLAQQAIDQLQEGDDALLRRLQGVLRAPYDEQPQHEDLSARRPDWARNRAGCSMLSCSS